MKSKKINKTKRRIKRNNLLVQSIHEDYYLDQYATTVRKKYGLKYKNNKGNIQSGLEHLMEMSHNNPLGISLMFVNLSDTKITVQYKLRGEWVCPTHNMKGKDKIPWSNIKPSLKFPLTDYHSIKQITAYLNTNWRILYDNKILEFDIKPHKDKKNNKHIFIFSKSKIKVTLKKLEDFIVHQINESDKINISDGYDVSWNSKS
tara:strand:+ start:1296 stop:1904 length:609 start_codon:yes stop_codon:yes gene_type:complete